VPFHNRWIGVDEQSKGVRVYWPNKKSVTVKWNVYFDRTSASRPEGEIDGLIRMKANAPVVLNTPSALFSSQTTEPLLMSHHLAFHHPLQLPNLSQKNPPLKNAFKNQVSVLLIF